MKSLKNTTAVLTALTLTMPQTGFAAAHISLDACGDDQETPCILDGEYVLVEVNGQGSITIPGLGTTEVMARDLLDCPAEGDLSTATPCLTADGNALFSMEGDEIDALAGDDLNEAVEEDAAEMEAVEGTEPIEEAEVEAEAEAPVENSDEPVMTEAVEGTGAVEGGDAVGEEEGDVDSVTEAADEPVGGAETADVTEDADEPVGTEMADTETEVEAEVEAETEVEAEVETETEVEADTEVANTDGETTIEEDTGAKTVQAPESEATAEAEAEAEVIVEDEPMTNAAAAAAEGESQDVQVETEEVTEANSRSAEEDFETSASGTETAAQTDSAAATSGGDGGMSNFEKALVLGLGAVVVGQALNNGDQVVSNSGDRVVVRQDNGELRVLKDDDALLRQPGSQVSTETFNDGSTRTTVLREDGTKIVTIRAADGRVVRRARVFEDGSQIILFDDTEAAEPVNTAELPQVETTTIDLAQSDEEALARALADAENRDMTRRFSLRQIRQIEQVRALAPQIELDAITFATGSAAIQPNQAEELRALGNAMVRVIDERPGEVFLIEGHTDTVGDASYNLALSDRRAETVALALAQYFDVPPENMITQGYGESQLKVMQEGDIRENRRAVIRRITPLLRQVASAN